MLSAPRNDDMLHFSQHLQHDRHTVLYKHYGYPASVQSWGRMFPLIQGTGVHETIHAAMREVMPVYADEWPIRIDDMFEYSWGGTADAYCVDKDDAQWLLDYKTISGAGMSFLTDEPKEEHLLQVSAYYHFGPKQNIRTAILYLPSSPDYKRNWSEPRLIEFEPLEYDVVVDRISEVEQAIHEYTNTGRLPDSPKGSYAWKKKGKAWELLYRPDYRSLFCPWASLSDDPCECSLDTLKKVAVWKDDTLSVEEGYDKVVDDVGLPTE